MRENAHLRRCAPMDSRQRTSEVRLRSSILARLAYERFGASCGLFKKTHRLKVDDRGLMIEYGKELVQVILRSQSSILSEARIG